MKMTVVAVGKLKERFWSDACAEYLKRLQPYARVTVKEVADVDPGRAGGVDAAREKEGAAVLAALGTRSHVLLLDIGGKQRSPAWNSLNALMRCPYKASVTWRSSSAGRTA